MRTSGMGWGEIAKELGIHPSVLGLRNTKKAQNQERTRHTKSFTTKNPGVNSGKSSGQGLGGKASSSAGKGGSNAGGSGKGGGRKR